jgi:hypothetical protein
MRMVINDRNMQCVLTRLIKFVMVDGLRLSVLNVMYHNGVIYTKVFLRPLCWNSCFVNILLYQALYTLPNLLPHIISGSGAPTSLIRSPLCQCFSTFVKPRSGKFFFYKKRDRSQQIYLSNLFKFIH